MVNDGSVMLLSLAIIFCAFLFEDATTVIVGVLAADGVIPVQIAFISLYIGSVVGDVALYSIGLFARTHPRLAHYIDHDFTSPFRLWIGRRYALKIFYAHFMPGFRFATFMASGFFKYPFRTYMPMAMSGGIVLITTLFSVSYWFGSVTSDLVSYVRWGIALAFLLIIFLIGRHNLIVYRAGKKVAGELNTDKSTQN